MGAIQGSFEMAMRTQPPLATRQAITEIIHQFGVQEFLGTDLAVCKPDPGQTLLD
jgi:hypothetical protein